MTDQTINRISWVLVIFAALVIGAIVYMTYYDAPQPPPIDPRTISLKEVAKDSLNAAQPVKIAHDETVKQAEELPKVKLANKKKWQEVAKVRISRSDSLQAAILIQRLDAE